MWINSNPSCSVGWWWSLPWRVLRRPSVWAGILAVLAYWDSRSLHGDFVYDDSGSVARNVVVTGVVPWTELWTRDFWGIPMNTPQSHKSYRPVTSATFLLNWKLAQHLEQKQKLNHSSSGSNVVASASSQQDTTYYFHVVNVLLHGIVTLLLVEVVSLFVITNVQSQLLTGMLFALHPVHAEAVSNITSRGELLMATFFLLAFVAYYDRPPLPDNNDIMNDDWNDEKMNNKKTACNNKRSLLLRTYMIPFVCMAMSMFSKEQGATTLLAVVLMDFMLRFTSVSCFVQQLLLQSRPKTTECNNNQARDFLIRACFLGAQTIVLCMMRIHINGETRPDFIEDQNPAGFARDRFTRIFSTNWIYILYLKDFILPTRLCPDWSGRSIDLIRIRSDPRILCVVLLWLCVAFCLYQLIFGSDTRTPLRQRKNPSHEKSTEITTSRTQSSSPLSQLGRPNPPPLLQQAFIAFWCLTVCPFLLSSNLLVVTGLMKADRVIYLPSAGLCVLQTLLIERMGLQPEPWTTAITATTKERSNGGRWRWTMTLRSMILHFLCLAQLSWYAAKTHERNQAWSSSELLWMESYRINPRSYHTMYNYGYELSLKKKYVRAEEVLRPIASPHVNGPSNTFVYSMVLQNLDRCDEANTLMDQALALAEEQQREASRDANSTTHANIRSTKASTDRVKSNLLVARSFCSKDMAVAGKLMYDAVQADPTNEYAVNQAKAMLSHYEKINVERKIL